jgi:hypothetical protein
MALKVLKNSTAPAVKNTPPTPFRVIRKKKYTLGLRPILKHRGVDFCGKTESETISFLVDIYIK